MSQSDPLAGTLDQARNVGQDEGAPIRNFGYAQIGFQGSKWVRRNFWSRVRQNGKQCRLPGVRNADQSDIRDQLQFQFDPFLFAGFTAFRGARRLMNGILQVRIASSTAPTLADRQLLARVGEITQQVSGDHIIHDRTRRDWYNEIIGGLSGHLIWSAILALLGYIARYMSKSLQSGQPLPDFQDHIAAPSAVPSIGTAARYKFFAVEVHHPIAPVA